jgi:hypothetical protein
MEGPIEELDALTPNAGPFGEERTKSWDNQ